MLARPAGAADDTGAAAALDGGSARKGQASRHSRRAGSSNPAQQKKWAAPAVCGAALWGFSAESIRVRQHLGLQLRDHARFNEDTRLPGFDRNVERPSEHLAVEMRQLTCAVGQIRLHPARNRNRHAAALRSQFRRRPTGRQRPLGAPTLTERRVCKDAGISKPAHLDHANGKDFAPF